MVMLFEELCRQRKWSESTKSLYKSCVELYEEVNHLSLDELIEEADREEEERIRWKKRTLKKRLIDFRQFLYENKSEGTAVRYFSCIKTVYNHFEIEIGTIPSFASKQVDKTYVKRFEDIPTKQEIIDAYYEASNVVKGVILFASSSGISKVDLLNLTVKNFITACAEYLTTSDLLEQLQELKSKVVIPTFEGYRQKTGTRFVTFCSPEAAEHIVQELLGRDSHIRKAYDEADDDEREDLPDKLCEDDKLFDISYSHLTYILRRINDKLKLGTVGKFRKFRCHQLRAFQASTLLNAENAFTESEVDALQGRKKDKTHRAYFVESTSKLKAKYESNVDELMLFKSVNNIDKEALEELQKENAFYKKEIVKNETKLEEQENRINQIIATQRELEAKLGL